MVLLSIVNTHNKLPWSNPWKVGNKVFQVELLYRKCTSRYLNDRTIMPMSKLADMAMTFKGFVLDLVFNIFFNIPSKTSVCKLRSWTSSSIMCETFNNSGFVCNFWSTIPVVQNVIDPTFFGFFESKRISYPTVFWKNIYTIQMLR